MLGSLKIDLVSLAAFFFNGLLALWNLNYKYTSIPQNYADHR